MTKYIGFTTLASKPIKAMSYEDFLALSGRYVSGEGNEVDVRLVEIDGKNFYLKTSHNEALLKRLPQLLRKNAWCSIAEQEARSLLSLEKKGFQVIPVAAFGSTYKLGIPDSGFMLTAEVKGVALDKILKKTNKNDDWFRYGELVATLQKAGCGEALRAKDILVDGNDWILLDRSKPLLKKLSLSKCEQSLQRMLYRNLRDGLQLDGLQREAFISAYIQANGPMPEPLIEQVLT